MTRPERTVKGNHVFAETGNGRLVGYRLFRETDSVGLPRLGYCMSIHVICGDRDEALRWLEQSYADHDPKLTFLKVDDRLASLQSDPRFADLCERIHP
jgi:hypothetical protein